MAQTAVLHLAVLAQRRRLGTIGRPIWRDLLADLDRHHILHLGQQGDFNLLLRRLRLATRFFELGGLSVLLHHRSTALFKCLYKQFKKWSKLDSTDLKLGLFKRNDSL